MKLRKKEKSGKGEVMINEKRKYTRKYNKSLAGKKTKQTYIENCGGKLASIKRHHERYSKYIKILFCPRCGERGTMRLYLWKHKDTDNISIGDLRINHYEDGKWKKTCYIQNALIKNYIDLNNITTQNNQIP